MSTDWRVAQLLHDEFAWGPYGGEDPWYYEIPTGANAGGDWKIAWDGREHKKFTNLAHDIAIDVFGFHPIGATAMRHVSMQDMAVVEDHLTALAGLIGKHQTAGAARRRSIKYDLGVVEDLRKTTHQHIDHTIDEALAIMPTMLP